MRGQIPERFLAEIETTANLTHPQILPLFDSGQADGFLFYVMPHIEGESLRERIDREKQLGVDDSVAITQKVANALDRAPRSRLRHRVGRGSGGRWTHHRDRTQPRHSGACQRQ